MLSEKGSIKKKSPIFVLKNKETQESIEMNLVIDVGNTAAKLAVFEGGALREVLYDSNRTLEQLPAFYLRHSPERAIWASVVDLPEEARERLESLPIPLIHLDEHTRIPVENLYETPHTLGYDRIAAVVGAVGRFPDRNLLVIDVGTCITYEFVDAGARYHGGNISPGIQMRFRALHEFTGRLPFVKREGRELPMGKDTDTAIRAGVLKGVEYEIGGYILEMKYKYPELLVFLTGGDEISFDTNVKNIIFADRFLVLKGLNRILEYNK